MKKPKQSNIKLNIKVEKKSLQRTKKWKIKRRGRWTGSQLKALMTCVQGKSRLPWDNLERLFSFGKTSIKYIYENAMERKSGKYVDLGDGTQDMRYGTKVEPLIQRATKKKLKEFGKLKEVGFKKFPTMKNAGVSSDSILVKNGKTIATVEMKACTNWGTHYERTFHLVNESSKDFWQIQGQTIAWGVTKCYYIVAEPPADIKKYLYYEGDIMDLYNDFVKECPISLIEVKASKLHQEALLKRICITENVLNDWLSIGGNLEKTLNKTIEFYHNAPEKLDKYILPLPFQKNKKLRDTTTYLKDGKKIRPDLPIRGVSPIKGALKKIKDKGVPEMKNPPPPPSEKGKRKTIKVAYPPKNESKKQWEFYTKQNKQKTSWSEPVWFPRSVCSLSRNDNPEMGVLDMPKWLYDRLIKNSKNGNRKNRK